MSSEHKSPNGSATEAQAGRLAAVWVRLGLFLAPVLLVVCLPVYLIDAYGLFAKHALVADDVRHKNAVQVNHVLLGIITYARRPTPNILLGDSQMNHFNVDEIETVTHRPYTNLSYGGGTLAESIATFWYAAGMQKLENVYFGISFYSFTDNARDRVAAAVRIVHQPLAYFSNGDVLQATWDDVVTQYFHQTVSYRPTVDVASFWRQQLAELGRRKQTYSASEQTLEKLREIVRYCQEHGIKISFIIPPEHEDVRRRIRELGMSDQYSEFKSTIATLGPTYDCDITNAITLDAANFQDPFHTTPAAGLLMTRSIWSGQNVWCDMRGMN